MPYQHHFYLNDVKRRLCNRNAFIEKESDNMGKYILKSFDEPLLKFTLERGEFNSFTLKIDWITSDKDKLPEKIINGENGVLNWLKGRMIPQNRTFVREILSSQQLEPHDLIGQLDTCMGLSVNDTYWVIKEGFNGKWLTIIYMITIFLRFYHWWLLPDTVKQ